MCDTLEVKKYRNNYKFTDTKQYLFSVSSSAFLGETDIKLWRVAYPCYEQSLLSDIPVSRSEM